MNGKLKYSMTLKNGADIYSIPLNLPYGEYTVTVTGDGCNITRTFTIGDEYKGKKESMILLQRGFFFSKLSILPIYFSIFISELFYTKHTLNSIFLFKGIFTFFFYNIKFCNIINPIFLFNCFFVRFRYFSFYII